MSFPLHWSWEGLVISVLAICLITGVVGIAETTPVVPNLIVKNNTIEGNGFGIYLGWGGYWVTEISGNCIINNAEGVRIVNAYTILHDNVITDNITGIRVASEHQGEAVTEVISVSLSGNSITNNLVYGLENLASLVVDARDNWWGDTAGPRLSEDSQPDGTERAGSSADRVFGLVDYTGWREEPLLPDLQAQADTTTSPNVPLPTAASPPQASPMVDSRQNKPSVADRPEKQIAFESCMIRMDAPWFAGLVSADFNGDGRLDLVLGAKYAQEIFVWLGDGSGRFTSKGNFFCGLRAKGMYVTDINGDEFIDLILVGENYEGVALLFGYGDGTFSEPSLLPIDLPGGSSISDVRPLVSELGKVSSLVLASNLGNTVLIYQWNNESSSFQAVLRLVMNRPRSPKTGDFNGDGLIDIALLVGAGEVVIFWGGEKMWDSTFTLVYQDQANLLTMGSADFDGDGLTDLVLSREEAAPVVVLMKHSGHPSLREIESESAKTATCLFAEDIDQDGIVDLIAVEPATGRFTILRSLGDGSFTLSCEVSTQYIFERIVIGDFNNDNTLDLGGLIKNSNQVVLFLQGE